MFEWVILTYGVIFGAIAVYLVTLWLRVREADRDLERR